MLIRAFISNHLCVLAKLQNSLATISHISWLWNFSIFFFLNSSIWIFSCSILTLSYGMWGLVSRPGYERGPPGLGAGNLRYYTTREVPHHLLLWDTHSHQNVYTENHMHLQRVGKVKPSQCTAELLPGLKLWNYLPGGKVKGREKLWGRRW